MPLCIKKAIVLNSYKESLVRDIVIVVRKLDKQFGFYTSDDKIKDDYLIAAGVSRS